MPVVETAWTGIKIQYEESANPYFEIIAKEVLGLIASKPVGLKLLTDIGKQSPQVNDGLPPGCTVLIVPTDERKFYDNTDGIRAPRDKRVMVPSGLSGSKNASLCAVASGETARGSACKLYFNNTIRMTSKGETTYPFIVMAHELIHSLHCLQGGRKDGKPEELCTTGIGDYAGEEITENKIRAEHGLPERTEYF